MKSVINLEQISNNLDKMELYKEQEDINFEEIRDVLGSINYNYDTNNTNKLENLENQLINKLNIITKIHNNNLLVFEKTITKYKTTSDKVERILDNINR